MDRFSYDGSEPKVVATCAYCAVCIREGDEVTRFTNGALTHSDCERNYRVHSRGVIDADGNID